MGKTNGTRTVSEPTKPESTNHTYRSLLEAELEIAGVPVGIVDPHHRVVPFWHHHLAGRKAHLLHIDAHSDMGVILGESEDSWKKPTTVKEMIAYTRKYLNIENFICAADYVGLLRSIYHYDPRESFIDVYREDQPARFSWMNGKERMSAKTGVFGELNHGICWSPFYPWKKTALSQVERRINRDAQTPLLLDIDLDAIQCHQYPEEPCLSVVAYETRLQNVFDLLQRLHRPALITIARSQTPGIPYVDPRRVDTIQRDVLDVLRDLYE